MCRPAPGQTACACSRHAPGPLRAGPAVEDLALDDHADTALPGRWRRPLGDWVEAAGGGPDLVEVVVLAVSEALSNAVEHAYPDQRPGPVRLRGTSTPPAPVALSAPGAGHRPVVAEDVVSGAVLQIVVSDRGRWLPPGEPQYRGRGLAIMRATAEDVDLTHTTTGTTVRLTWTLPSGA